MTLPSVGPFYLVGGTALALQMGHRLSVDLDLFTTEPFDTEKLLNSLSNDFSISVAAGSLIAAGNFSLAYDPIRA